MSATMIVNEAKLGIGESEKLSTLTIQPRAPFDLTGTLNKTASSQTVTGTGTKFLSEIGLGDQLDIPGNLPDENDYPFVLEVVSDTELTVEPAPSTTGTGVTAICFPSVLRGQNANGETGLLVDWRNHVSIGLGSTAMMLGAEAKLIANQPDNGLPALILSNSAEGESMGGISLSVQALDGGSRELVISPVDSSPGLPMLSMSSVGGVQLHTGMRITGATDVNISTTLAATEYLVFADAGVSGIELSLPPIAENNGKTYCIYKTAGAGDVTVTPDATDAINGINASKTIATPFAGIWLFASETGGGWVATALTPA